MHKIDGPGATTDNKWTEGDPSTSTPATEVTADFMNAVQGELVEVITHYGIQLDKADNTQLRQAIQQAVSNASIPDATTTAAGKIQIATQSEVNAGTASNVAVVPSTLAGVNFAASKINSGVFPFARGGTGASTKSGARAALDISNVADKSDGAETSGTHYATGGFQKSSGRHLKRDIKPLKLTRAQRKAAKRLRLKQWIWRKSGKPDAGVMADDVMEVAPWTVSRDSRGRPSSVDYGALAVHLTLLDQARRRAIARALSAVAVACAGAWLAFAGVF